MSRHVPLLHPFFKEFERDFWTDRPSIYRQRSEWDTELPSRLFDQHFAKELSLDEPQGGSSSLYFRGRRPQREHSGVSVVTPSREKFAVMLDVPQFTPEELKVRVSASGQLEVEGRHEERQDPHGSVSRQFVRKYDLPEDVLTDQVSSFLSAEGVLTVEAPRKPPSPPRPSEREVPIHKVEKQTA